MLDSLSIEGLVGLMDDGKVYEVVVEGHHEKKYAPRCTYSTPRCRPQYTYACMLPLTPAASIQSTCHLARWLQHFPIRPARPLNFRPYYPLVASSPICPAGPQSRRPLAAELFPTPIPPKRIRREPHYFAVD